MVIALGAGVACRQSAPPPPQASASAQAPSPLFLLAARRGVEVAVVGRALAPAPADVPLVTLSKTELYVGDTRVATIPAGELGFPAGMKRSGLAAALHVLPVEDAVRDLRATGPAVDSLRLLVDAGVPYRALLEVVYSAAHAGVTSFSLIVMSESGEGALPIRLPTRAEREESKAPGAVPPPAFVIDRDGVSISVGQEPIGAGCTRGAAGAAVALQSGRADPRQLAECAERMHGMDEAWARNTSASVSATSAVPMQAVLEAIAAILPVYPTVHVGMVSG
jgi:hypothetical protein